MHCARLAICFTLLASLSWAAPSAAAGGSPKPPAHAAAIVAHSTPSSGQSGALAVGTLRKGKKGQILRIDVSSVFGASSAGVSGSINSVSVNGFFITLPYPDRLVCSSALTLCAVNFTLWLDLDAPDEGTPDEFVGQPLAVEVEGGMNYSGGPGAGSANTRLLLELVKK